MAIDIETLVQKQKRELRPSTLSVEKAKAILRENITWTLDSHGGWVRLFHIDSTMGHIRHGGSTGLAMLLDKSTMQQVGLEVMSEYGLDTEKYEEERLQQSNETATETRTYASKTHQIFFKRSVEYVSNKPTKVTWSITSKQQSSRTS